MNRPLDTEALRDYWAVYTSRYQQIHDESMKAIAGHPVFGPLIASMPADAMEAQREQSLALTRGAIFDGGWDAYAGSLYVQGASYARMGLRFDSWYDVVRVYQRIVIAMLVDEFGGDLPRLTRVLVAAQDFLDRAMAVISNAYFETKEQALDAARTLAENRASELEASELAVRQQSVLLRGVLDSIPDGIVVVDASGDYTLVNRAANEIMGHVVSSSDDVTTEVFDAVTNEPVPRDRFPTHRAARGERFDDVELRRVAPGGEQVISSFGRPLDGEAGVRGGIVCFRDVTERKRMAAMQAHSEQLEAENERIHTANRMKSEFLANMSHELRTPLNAIIGFAELLVDDAVEPGSPEYGMFLSDILSSGRHLLSLINDILDLSKVEAGKIEFRPETIDPAECVSAVAMVLRGQAGSKNIRVEAEVDPEVGEVSIDPGRFKQILYNYVSNALKFTREGGRVVIRLRPESESTFRVEVEDNGIGIAEADLARLFVEFEQLDGGIGKTQGGTGLGLALTRRLVEAQGGYAGATSTLGEGSVFYAVLPRRATNSFQLPERFVRRGAKPDAPCILVVEDDPRDQAYLVRTLTAAGYAIETASSATQALASLHERHFDAVTLDVFLPDVNGFDLLREIRRDPTHAKRPVVVVSVDQEHAGAAGLAVDEYLVKPVEASALLDALHRLGIEAERSDVLVVDDDPAALRLMEATLAQAGHRAICESDAEAALESCRRSPPAAVIVDLLMPRVDGFEFLDRLRRDPSLRHVPVIVWSAKDITAEEHARLRTRSHAVVRKGSAVPLLDEIRALLPLPRR